MSDNAIIRVENLGKRYRIQHQQAGGMRYRTLRDVIAQKLKAPFQFLRRAPLHSPLSALPSSRASHEDFWALKDVSFEIKRGEVVGIIGRNGAGKSTLLKILSRITEPTEGRVRIRGRVASLLEVGTGFHPELTGRENIFLNGAILGMSKFEIKRKFDEIVAFAEIEKFLDTPVKRYSSGMYVRLAFAVAAHLEPEILIVDEVLAVGDAEFQKKCLGKMESVSRNEGRTVLFVSHNMATLQLLCLQGIVLERGTVVIHADANTAISTYLSRLTRLSALEISARTDRRGSGRAQIVRVRVRTGSGESTLMTGKKARFEFEVSRLLPRMTCCFTIYNQTGQPLAHFSSSQHSADDTQIEGDSRLYICETDQLQLLRGSYRLNAALEADGEGLDHVEAAAVFEVEPGTLDGRFNRGKGANCDICMAHRWVLPNC